MPVQSESELIEFEGWRLRVRPAIKAPARLLVLLHGRTGDENSTWVFVRNFPGDYLIMAPRAPHVTRPSGYSWRSEEPGQPDLPGLVDFRPAAKAVVGLIEAYSAANSIDSEQFETIGFSQGAALVNTLALLYPQRIRRAGVLAGFVPRGAEALLQDHPLEGKPFFVAHGTLDEMVSVEIARQSVELLTQAGGKVTFCEDEVGHKVSSGCLRGLEAFFT